LKKAIITILLVLVADQWLKLWIKLHFHYGETRPLIPGWFDLQFVENPGMAFGWMIPGDAGKLTLSIFRIAVVFIIIYYLLKFIREKAHTGLVISMALIIAGALGNIIDSAAYGLMFDKGSRFDADVGDYTMYFGKARLSSEGYAPFLMGNVVDMLHFSKEITIGGKTREIFPPVFNIADSSITAGILLILLFQKRFFKHKEEKIVQEISSAPSDETVPDDSPQHSA
jgi:signal peptidase II